MCSIDIDDRADVWNEREVTARKAHRCAACHVPIAPGERYLSHFSAMDRRGHNEACCLACQKIRIDFADEHEGVMMAPSETPYILIECVNEGEGDSDRWKRAYDEVFNRRMAVFNGLHP